MRDIKCRGYNSDENEWVYGAYWFDSVITDSFIFPFGRQAIEVDVKSIGQYTGLKDKNGKEIYEGDIAIGKRGGIPYKFEVKWDEVDARFLGYTNTGYICYVGQEPSVEIIGNIYENPELLESEVE